MSRPRLPTSDECETCRTTYRKHSSTGTLAVLHRFEHLRADRRRAQWRNQKRRSRRDDGRIASLHDLGCKMPTRCTCKPIPVYR